MENLLQIVSRTITVLRIPLIKNASLTSYVVRIIGQIVVKIQHKKSIKQQEDHHQSTLKQQEIQHKQNIEQQQRHYIEAQKTSKKQFLHTIMPFFQLERNIKTTERNGYTIIELQLKNIGNGIATNVHMICKEDSTIVFCDSPNPPNKTYYYCDPLYNDIFRINESQSFSLLLEYDSTGSVLDILNTCGKCVFSIGFTDTELNKYTQEFSFIYNIQNDSYEPIIRNGEPKPVNEIEL